MVVVDANGLVGQETMEFAVVDAPARLESLSLLVDDQPRPERAAIAPFRSRAADLVDLFGTMDAQTPWWHRARARDLRREAHSQTVAAVNTAYMRLAARHLATAQLLEDDGGCWAETA